MAYALSATLLTAQTPEQEPSPTTVGKVYEWQSSAGLRYQFYLPKSYDQDAGINLTFILHGSNLDRRWGFANHKAGQFRADDLVVCPDGTTSNNNGGYNFLQSTKDLERLHALQEELQKLFKVRATYVYGHSQGSFFAFLYAGAYPSDVQGLVGQASGVWIGTQATKKHHHQAVVLMHGTADPVVPYGQSIGGLKFYSDAKYPHARLRSLDGWNHWPIQSETEQQLAWCEGMTTADNTRLASAFELLNDQKGVVDPVALYQVAARVTTAADMPAATTKAAAAAMADVNECAEKHAQAIRKSSGTKSKRLEAKPWIAHLPLLMRHFAGVPACDTLAEEWRSTLEAQDKLADKHARAFWQNSAKKPDKAFADGIKLVHEAFLTRAAANEEILSKLDTWHGDAKKLGIGKADQKLFKAGVPVLREAHKQGREAFDKVSKRFR